MNFESTSLVRMPEHIEIYNACNEPCDVLIGPCSCGAWHSIKDWDDKIENVEQYLK